MNSGDILLLYTDGLIEAKNKHDDQFGIIRLTESFIKTVELDTGEIINSLMKDIEYFAEDGDLKEHQGHYADDITMVVIRKK